MTSALSIFSFASNIGLISTTRTQKPILNMSWRWGAYCYRNVEPFSYLMITQVLLNDTMNVKNQVVKKKLLQTKCTFVAVLCGGSISWDNIHSSADAHTLWNMSTKHYLPLLLFRYLLWFDEFTVWKSKVGRK